MSLKNRLARLMHREGVTPLPTKILVTLFFVVVSTICLCCLEHTHSDRMDLDNSLKSFF